MLRGRRSQNDFDIFNFPLTSPERPKPSPSPPSSRRVSVRIGSSLRGKLTSGERLRLAKTLNRDRLTQSIRRQKREREKAEAFQKILARRKEDPNLVYDLTDDAPLGDQAKQLAQSDELVSEDDEDEEDFAPASTVRALFESPTRDSGFPDRIRKRPKPPIDSHEITEISDQENIPKSYLKKRRLTEPRKHIGIPISSPVFAPNVQGAICNKTAQRKQEPKPTSVTDRSPLQIVECNGPRKRSQHKPSQREVFRKERRQRPMSTSASGELVLNISCMRAIAPERREIHEISDDDSCAKKYPRRTESTEQEISRNRKASNRIVKRPRSKRNDYGGIPAKTFYGKNDRSQRDKAKQRIVIPLLKDEHRTDVPSEEIARLRLEDQQSSQCERRQKSQKGRIIRKIHQTSSDEDDKATDSKIDIRFKPLIGPELEVVRSLTFKVPKMKVMAKIEEANIELKAGDFGGLRGSRWLNDEIMNSFVALINARNRRQTGKSGDKKSIQKNASFDEDDEIMEVSVASAKPMEVFRRPRPRTHVFNTFFFPRLSQHGYDYGGVRRWLKKAGRDIRELDLIMFPINLSNFHWVLAAIDLRGKQLLYFDSTYAQDSSDAIPLLRRWLYDEVIDKHGIDAAAEMNINTWGVIVNPSYLPEQKDGGSCGIFTLYMAEYLEQGRRPDFTQNNIRTMRQRTAIFLKRGKLPDC